MVDTRDNNFNIVLIGFMATGKTTVAKELSKSLRIKYIDIDKMVEERMETSISEIFKKYGERYFRQIEKETVKAISKFRNTVISCGGGVCLDPENISNLKRKGKIVLLEANPGTILDRVKNDENRPLLKGKDHIEAIKDIMERRRDSYHKSADIIINTSGKSVLDVRDEILKELNL